MRLLVWVLLFVFSVGKVYCDCKQQIDKASLFRSQAMQCYSFISKIATEPNAYFKNVSSRFVSIGSLKTTLSKLHNSFSYIKDAVEVSYNNVLANCAKEPEETQRISDSDIPNYCQTLCIMQDPNPDSKQEVCNIGYWNYLVDKPIRLALYFEAEWYCSSSGQLSQAFKECVKSLRGRKDKKCDKGIFGDPANKTVDNLNSQIFSSCKPMNKGESISENGLKKIKDTYIDWYETYMDCVDLESKCPKETSL